MGQKNRPLAFQVENPWFPLETLDDPRNIPTVQERSTTSWRSVVQAGEVAPVLQGYGEIQLRILMEWRGEHCSIFGHNIYLWRQVEGEFTILIHFSIHFFIPVSIHFLILYEFPQIFFGAIPCDGWGAIEAAVLSELDARSLCSLEGDSCGLQQKPDVFFLRTNTVSETTKDSETASQKLRFSN